MSHARSLVSLAAVLASSVGVACVGSSTDTSPLPIGTDAGLGLDAAPGADASADVVTNDAPDTNDAAANDGGPAPDAGDDGAVDAGDAADAADAADAGPPGTIGTSAAAAVQKDLVSPSDVGLTGDGSLDGTIEATIVGPVDGLILVTTDAAGNSAGGQEWDTLVGSDPVPSIGSGFSTGSNTWILGVFEASTLLNDGTGRVTLAAGPHALTLAASSSGYFVTGQHFRLYAHAAGGTWEAGPVFTWP